MKTTLKQKIISTIVAAGITLGSSIPALAGNVNASIKVYDDSRDRANVCMTASAGDIANTGVNYFSFVDFASDIGTNLNQRFNLENIYSEHRLSKRFENGFGPAMEYNGNLKDYGIWRYGLVYEPGFGKIIPNTNLSLKWLPVSTPDKGSQLGLYGGRKLNYKFSVGGYLDYNTRSESFVSDIQLNYKLDEDISAFLMLRYTDFENKDKFGIGLGLEYNL